MDTPPIRPVDLSGYLAQASPAESELARLFSPTAPLTIFDIGACEGEESIRFSRRFPDARIYTFEPLPANQNVIRENFRLYQVSNAELIPAALSNRAGTVDFHVSSGRPKDLFSGENWNYGNKSSSLLPPASATPMHGWIEFKEKITVPSLTLDEFCRERGIRKIDFIHMDVQGAEFLVLEGAAEMLKRSTSVWLEVADEALYRGQKLRSEVERFFRNRGFVRTYYAPNGLEGDQMYLNLNYSRNWIPVVAYALRRLLRRSRAGGSQVKKSIRRAISR